MESLDFEPTRSSNSVRKTDSVQNLLWGLRLKSENTEEEPPGPSLRVRVPGVVVSAASGDGTRASMRRTSADTKGAAGSRKGLLISPAGAPRRRTAAAVGRPGDEGFGIPDQGFVACYCLSSSRLVMV